MRPVEPAPEGVRLTLYVQPRASRTELTGLHGNALKIRLAAPPVDGAANLELVRFLAKLLGVARSSVELTAGTGGRRKTVLVRRVTVQAVERKLGLAP
jgi:uncharacterized protein